MERLVAAFTELADTVDMRAAHTEMLGEPPPPGIDVPLLRQLAVKFREIAGLFETAR